MEILVELVDFFQLKCTVKNQKSDALAFFQKMNENDGARGRSRDLEIDPKANTSLKKVWDNYQRVKSFNLSQVATKKDVSVLAS